MGKEHQAFNETALLQQRVESIRGKVSKKLVAFSVINGLCYKRFVLERGEALRMRRCAPSGVLPFQPMR